MMILTCPNCATRFFAEPEEIGPAGRRVHCSACAAEWVAYRADQEKDATTAPEAVAQASAPDASPPTPAAEDHPATEAAEPVREERAETAEPEPEPTEAEAEALDEPVSTPLADDSMEEPAVATSGAAPADPISWSHEEPEPPPTASPAESPLFSERPVPGVSAKRSGRGLGVTLLVLLVIALAVIAGVVYLRQHHGLPGASGTVGLTAPSTASG